MCWRKRCSLLSHSLLSSGKFRHADSYNLMWYILRVSNMKSYGHTQLGSYNPGLGARNVPIGKDEHK